MLQLNKGKGMKNCNGSVVLATLIVMTALIIIIHSVLRASTYLVLLSREREVYEEKIKETA
jgi:hypothetical protein